MQPDKKTLLVINTGSLKKRFIFQKLKKLPIQVVVVNKEKNWASAYVDDWILADTTNHSEVIQRVDAYRRQHRIDGVMTFWEDDVLLTAKLGERLQLVGIPHAVARQVRNKLWFRQFCQQQGLPTPQFRPVNSLKDVKVAAKELQFPVVIKPAYGASSAFVIKANDLDELLNAFEYVQKNATPTVESALSDGLELFVEEFIDGDEVDIDILLQNSKVKFISVADNHSTKEPFFLERRHVLPSNLPEPTQEKLKQMAEEVLERLGVQHGCIHFEAKVTKHGPVPIEINLRMGGDETYSSVKKVWGVDLVDDAAKIALGEYFPKQYALIPKSYLVTETLHAPQSGIVSSLHVDEAELKKDANVEQFFMGKNVGDPVLVPPEGFEYMGWVTVSGENFLDAQDNLEKALKHISYEVVKFNEGSVVGKTERKSRFSAASITKSMVLGAAKIEHLRRTSRKDQRKLRIGVACNTYSSAEGEVEADLATIGKRIQDTLMRVGYETLYIDFNDLPRALHQLETEKVDLIFNVCERINNSSLLEPHAAAIFDAFQIPYTGSNPFTLGLCIDKIRVKKLLTYHSIPTPKWDYAYSMDDDLEEDLRYPLIVKPANTDNSIGITNDSIVTDKKQLQRQLEYLLKELKRPALVEEYIEGDEYDVSILGSEYDDLRVLPLSRSIFDKMPEGYWHIYPFEAKFQDNEVYNKIVTQRPPKNISAKLQSLISEIALDTYNILDCHDYGRVEIRVDKDNNPYVLELNPNPSIDENDCVPYVASMVGMNYGDFLEEIIALAIRRYQNKPPYYHLQANLL